MVSFLTPLLVPDDWTVHDAHQMVEDFDGDLRAVRDDVLIAIPLEPMKGGNAFHAMHEK